MRPLIIDTEARKRIQYAVRYGNHNPLREEDLQSGTVFADEPHRMVFLDFGYRVVYSVQQKGSEWFRHLTVSLPQTPESLPGPTAVEEIAQEFGFVKVLGENRVFLDGKANVVEIIEKQNANPS